MCTICGRRAVIEADVRVLEAFVFRSRRIAADESFFGGLCAECVNAVAIPKAKAQPLHGRELAGVLHGIAIAEVDATNPPITLPEE